jgi:hypothetical protein
VRDASDWYGTSYALSKDKQAVMAKAASAGCIFVPYYDAHPKEFNLYFGNRLARSLYSRRLAALYPEFFTFNGRRFEDFVDFLSPAQTEQRLSGKCVYLFGSPIERFTDFGIPASELMPIAQSKGGLGDALAIYQLSPKIIDQLKSETPR